MLVEDVPRPRWSRFHRRRRCRGRWRLADVVHAVEGARASISSLRYARGMLYMTIHDVLFATDFSDASRLAGETAAEFARHFGARLHVLHVVPPVTDPTPTPGCVARRRSGAREGTLDRDGDRLGPGGATGRGLCPPQRHRSHRPRDARESRMLCSGAWPRPFAAPRLGTSSSARHAERGSAVRRSTTSAATSAPGGERSHGGYATERKSGAAAVPWPSSFRISRRLTSSTRAR